MKNVMRCMAVLVLCSTSCAWASGVVRIADGDCDALSAAVNSSPGTEPSLIILARNGFYGCTFTVNGNITIDGAGSNYYVANPRADSPLQALITVASGATLTFRNVNFTQQSSTSTSAANSAKPDFIIQFQPVFSVSGTLVFDSVSVINNQFTDGTGEGIGAPFIAGGNVFMRNTTISLNYAPLIEGNVTISNSTIANNGGFLFDFRSTVSIGNSIIVGNKPGCAVNPVVSSLGGNVTDDSTCKLSGTNDRLVADAHLLETATHGGIVQNVALRNDSPAIGNAIVANCEATDSRGFSRGQTACDSGAYEFGGDDGQISATGMSGLFYNPANDGHYVTIQRLHNDTALVIWNTFDENGTPAWLYGVGDVSGQSIHVSQVGRNSGGKLLPGGEVVGSHAALWGTIDVNLSDCYNGTLSYNSPDPNFGSGSTPLTRLAFLDGVNCAP